MPPIPWDQLFDLLFKLLEDCADDTEARIVLIKERPVARYISVVRSLRQLGFYGKNLREAAEIVVDEIKNADPQVIAAFAQVGPKALDI